MNGNIPDLLSTPLDREIARERARGIEAAEGKRYPLSVLVGLGLGALLFLALGIDPMRALIWMPYLASLTIVVTGVFRIVGTQLARSGVPGELTKVVQDDELERFVVLYLPTPYARLCFSAFHGSALVGGSVIGILVMAIVAGMFLGQ